MTTRSLLGSAPLLFLLGGAVACSHATEAPAASDSEVNAPFSPYPFEMRDIRALGRLDPFNTTIANFGSEARDQGKIASCASHGFLGMIENQLWNERGISIDLSERFQLYANFMDSKNMGSDPAVIVRFPEITSHWGILPESAYAYAEVMNNADRFEQDAAQGLSTDPNALTIDKAIEATSDRTEVRSDILQRGEFLGELPAGPYPVALPMKADLAPGALVPELEFEGRLYECFAAGGPESVPPEKRLSVTPREFAHKCLGIQPKEYFACQNDLEQIAGEAVHGLPEDECAQARAAAEAIGAALAKRNTEYLNLTMRLVDQGQAVMVGVMSPQDWGHLSVWFGRQLQWGGGHAVVVGYVTYDELARVEEQARGMLGQGIFDGLAGAVEPEYAAKVAAGELPSDPAARRDARIATKLGKLIKEEGGLLLFRNSWGTKVDHVEIGVQGYQSMTFDFFLKSTTLVQSRANARVAGVSWERDAGPSYCPSSALPTVDPWLAKDHTADVTAFVRGFAVPPACAQ